VLELIIFQCSNAFTYFNGCAISTYLDNVRYFDTCEMYLNESGNSYLLDSRCHVPVKKPCDNFEVFILKAMN
jgi:hypothetical protein